MAETKAAYTHVGPGLPPLYGARAKALILGSFPSPKSREQGFHSKYAQHITAISADQTEGDY